MAQHSNKSVPPPVADDLNPEELEWLQEHRRRLAQFCEAAGLPEPRADADRLDASDDFIRWWHAQPETERPDSKLIINMAAVALGDALAAECGLEWRLITDAFGTDFGLWSGGDSATATKIILSPTSSVAKRFAQGRDGFVVDLFRHLVEGVAHMRARGGS